MRYAFSLICLLLLGCGFETTGGMPERYSTYDATTQIHKPLAFSFLWKNDSLVKSCANLKNGSSSYTDEYGNPWNITYGTYLLESSLIDADSLKTGRCLSTEDTTLLHLFEKIDSTQHLKFSLTDSMHTVKSYDLDLSSVFFYNKGKHYDIRGDSVDIFLPGKNFYVSYFGSCYNGVDNFSDMSSKLDGTYVYEGHCIREIGLSDSLTITLEIAALHSMSFTVHLDFEKESSLKTDSFSFSWVYEL